MLRGLGARVRRVLSGETSLSVVARHLGGRARVVLAGVLAPPVLFGAALVARFAGSRRARPRDGKPRLLWGPTPLISIMYWSEAMKRAGYRSTTCVTGHYAINAHQDFDRYLDEPPVRRAGLLGEYSPFLWTLKHADVYFRFLDWGYLAATPWKRLELPLLRLAGKKVIASPFGSDTAMPGHLGPAEAAVLADYPMFIEQADATRSRVEHFARWADLVIENMQYGFMPRADVLWPTQLGIDIDAWDSPPGSDNDGRNGEVVVLHAPNHRRIKGTEELLAAVEGLREEGLDVRVDLLEGRPNQEIRQAMRDCDMVAEQFLVGYGMFAVEGMAAGRPVLSNIGALPDHVRATPAIAECPIVDTATEEIADRIRELALDPQRRREIGRTSRQFAVEHHSYEAVAAAMTQLLEVVWDDAPLSARSLG
jgi:glycosyltransferase involved in cell wall biosynthesis